MNKENLILDKNPLFFIIKDQTPFSPKVTKANQNDTLIFYCVGVMIQTQNVLVKPSVPRKWFVVQCAADPMTEICESCVQ